MGSLETNSFYDRHYFYDGKYIGTVLGAIRREDYAKVKLLTGADREKFLSKMFRNSQWRRVFDEE